MEGTTMLVISQADLESIIENKVLSALKQYLHFEKNKDREPDILTIVEAASYLNLKKATLYVMKCQNTIPFLKRGGAVCFSKTALEQWNATGRPKNPNLLEIEADEQLALIRKKKK